MLEFEYENNLKPTFKKLFYRFNRIIGYAYKLSFEFGSA